VAPLVGFCGSRSLPASASALVAGVVGSVLGAPGGRGVCVGCALGGDALVVSSVLRAGASGAARLSVFAAFGPISPALASPGQPAPRVSAPGASRSVSSVSGVAAALAAGASVSWWAGGGEHVPLAGRLASRSSALVRAVASSGSEAGAGFVGFVSSPCPAGVAPSPSPSRCFSGSGSGSWASLALVAGLGLPVVVFPLAGVPLPSSWPGSWSPCSSAFAGGFRFVPAAAPLF